MRAARRSDRSGGADLLIAAAALEYGLTVVTRNVRHFLPTGVPVEDPFQDMAEDPSL
jgi:toxin FitB